MCCFTIYSYNFSLFYTVLQTRAKLFTFQCRSKGKISGGARERRRPTPTPTPTVPPLWKFQFSFIATSSPGSLYPSKAPWEQSWLYGFKKNYFWKICLVKQPSPLEFPMTFFSKMYNSEENFEFDLYFVLLAVQTGSSQACSILQDILYLLHTVASRSRKSFNTGCYYQDSTHLKPLRFCRHARSWPVSEPWLQSTHSPGPNLLYVWRHIYRMGTQPLQLWCCCIWRCTSVVCYGIWLWTNKPNSVPGSCYPKYTYIYLIPAKPGRFSCRGHRWLYADHYNHDLESHHRFASFCTWQSVAMDQTMCVYWFCFVWYVRSDSWLKQVLFTNPLCQSHRHGDVLWCTVGNCAVFIHSHPG